MRYRKYYRLWGTTGHNKNLMKFYYALRYIGKMNGASNSKCIPTAMNMIRKRVNAYDHLDHNVSNNEIRNLISAKTWCGKINTNPNNRYCIYRLSVYADVILSEIIKLIKETEKNCGMTLTDFSRNRIQKGLYCKNEMVFDIDTKMKKLSERAPRSYTDRVNSLRSNIQELERTC